MGHKQKNILNVRIHYYWRSEILMSRCIKSVELAVLKASDCTQIYSDQNTEQKDM